MKYFMSFMAVCFFGLIAVGNSYGGDITVGDPSPVRISCAAPTEYANGTRIHADDVLTYQLYFDIPDSGIFRASLGLSRVDCEWNVTLPANETMYIFYASAISSKFGSESIDSNRIEVNILPVGDPLINPIEVCQ